LWWRKKTARWWIIIQKGLSDRVAGCGLRGAGCKWSFVCLQFIATSLQQGVDSGAIIEHCIPSFEVRLAVRSLKRVQIY
jgi:hypothetical protein